ncbi:ClC family H(+)/Cl(-) exchange transporter [Loigolactobacillus iwatensis]|uniref:ClC family H(+)/Cl(-) exchange transporter n=1 Tax=Loigolactobacillus iwatensis TaxID=1267156 RepID=UPI000F7F767A
MVAPKKLHRVDTTHLVFILKGLLVGVLTGIVVSLFRLFIEKSLAAWTWAYLQAQKQPLILLAILAGLMLMAVFIAWLIKAQPHIMGSGIPEVEGQLAGELEVHWWSILWRKFIGGILGIGSGLFLGREGPSIQLGAAVGQGVAERFKDVGMQRRVLIASGAASGLAAAFNAPIAGTLFVLEEVYHNFSPLVWMSSLAGAIGANFVTTNFFGLVPVLHITYAHSFPLSLYWHLILLGLILGGLGYFYQVVLLKLPGWYARFIRLPRYLNGLVPFILVIPIGYFWPRTLGGGNGVILTIAKVNPSIRILIGLLILRFVFSMISYGSGLPGGIFLPILTLGAIIGALYGTIMFHLGLLPKDDILNLLIFSMAGYFAGIGKAPFTAILLITEMVGTLQHLMPLAVVSLTAYVVVDLLGGAPIYASLLERMNLGKKLNVLSGKNDRVEVPIFTDSHFAEQQVRDIKWPDNTLLMAIRRGEREIIPRGDTSIHSGDTLIVLTDHNQRAHIRQMLTILGKSKPMK